MATKKKRITISLSEGLYDHLVIMCDYYSCTKSEFICALMDGNIGVALYKKSKRKRHSVNF